MSVTSIGSGPYCYANSLVMILAGGAVAGNGDGGGPATEAAQVGGLLALSGDGGSGR
jgi:hypothetical protein